VDTVWEPSLALSNPGLFYFNKGKMKGMRGRRRKIRRQVASVMSNGATTAAPAKADVLVTIKKIKAVPGEVGGLRKLADLVAALSE